MIHFWEDCLMANENVVKIRMDKPIFFNFIFCLQYHLGGLFASLFSSKYVSKPAGGSSVWQGKLLSWKCECDEQVDCGPGSTKTVALSPPSAGKTCVWNFVYNLSFLYSTVWWTFTPRMSKLRVCRFTYVLYCVVLGGQVHGEPTFREKLRHSWVYPGNSHRSLNGHCTGRLGCCPDSSWLGHQHFVGVIWFGILEGLPLPPVYVMAMKWPRQNHCGEEWLSLCWEGFHLMWFILKLSRFEVFPMWWTGAIYYKN